MDQLWRHERSAKAAGAEIATSVIGLSAEANRLNFADRVATRTCANAEVGRYELVELSQLSEMPAKDLKKIVDDAGLKNLLRPLHADGFDGQAAGDS